MGDDPRSRDDTERQRDRVGASSGSDHPFPHRAQRERSILPGASLRAQARSRGEPHHRSPPSQNQSQPTPGNQLLHGRKPPRPPWPRQPTRAAGSGRSELRQRSSFSPSRAARKVHPPRSFLASAGPVPRSGPSTHPWIASSRQPVRASPIRITTPP